MTERIGDKDVVTEMHQVLLQLASVSPHRTVDMSQALQSLSEKYWDYDSSDARDAFSILLSGGLISLAATTNSVVVADVPTSSQK